MTIPPLSDEDAGLESDSRPLGRRDEYNTHCLRWEVMTAEEVWPDGEPPFPPLGGRRAGAEVTP